MIPNPDRPHRRDHTTLRALSAKAPRGIQRLLAMLLPIAAVAVVASAGAVAAAEDQSIPGKTVMKWDLSAGNAVAKVPWPAEKAVGTRYSLQGSIDLELLLPNGAVLHEIAGLVSVERSGELINSISIQAPPQTLEQAHAHALAVCAALRIPVAGVERWYEQAVAGGRGLGGSLGLDRAPSMAVRLLNSYNADLPWLVAVDVSWFVDSAAPVGKAVAAP